MFSVKREVSIGVFFAIFNERMIQFCSIEILIIHTAIEVYAFSRCVITATPVAK